MLRRDEREGGASMVRMDMRYMWSEMDSPCLMWKRHQPSRLVVFRRSRRWKKGIGLVGAVEGGGVWRVARTVGSVSDHVRCLGMVFIHSVSDAVGLTYLPLQTKGLTALAHVVISESLSYPGLDLMLRWLHLFLAQPVNPWLLSLFPRR